MHITAMLGATRFQEYLRFPGQLWTKTGLITHLPFPMNLLRCCVQGMREMFDLELVLESSVCVLIFTAKLSCDSKAPTFCLFPKHIPQEDRKCCLIFGQTMAVSPSH